MKSPVSTYRLQVNADFKFAAVRALLEYFRDLGVGTLYFSPVFSARPGSPHGYDVTDPSRFNRDVGDEAEFTELSSAAAAHGMSILLDIVPNHMAASEENPWWHELLEHGPAATTAEFFDIDWNAPGANRQLVLPILGSEAEDCAQRGEIRLELRDDELKLVVHSSRVLPVDPGTYGVVLGRIASITRGATAAAANQLAQKANVGPRQPVDMATRQQRRHATQALKQIIREQLKQPEFRTAFDTALQQINQTPDQLFAILKAQPYQLEFWRTGMKRLNYRRFFDIADLAGVRVEDRDVFEVTHTLTLELILSGLIEGVRIDHIDGLRDPLAYLTRLRAAVGDTYVVVEKILAPSEELRSDWPVQGTTGYDFVGFINGLFAHPDGLNALSEDYARRTGKDAFADIVYEKKKLVIDALFTGEANSLAHELERLVQLFEPSPDAAHVRDALVELSACLSIYRTYIRDQVVPEDRNAIKQALTTARHRAPHIPDTIYGALRRILLLEDLPDQHLSAVHAFITGWQQFTGPVMAKGLEDTAFYTYHRLISLSEVGSNPASLETSVTHFHETISRRAQRWPFTMNTTSTHDTKRSEDVRARLSMLTEMAPEWSAALDRWIAMNSRHHRHIDDKRVPAINEEILIYQTLVGVWPFDDDDVAEISARLRTFLLKAAREAKDRSSWLEPNEPHEQALFTFVDAILRDDRFLDDFLPLQREISWYGALTSLSQLVIKLGAPGVPDFYQGNELWDLSLVDPDNRRPVDFDQRKRLLQELIGNTKGGSDLVQELMTSWTDGRIKLYLTWTGLQLRKQNPGLLLHGEYIPVFARGPQEDCVVAFARRFEDRTLLFAVSRFFRHLAGPGQLPTSAVWHDTRLQLPPELPRQWQNILTNEPAEGDSLASYFSTLPFGIYAAR